MSAFVALATAYILFASPIVGMADNGDFHRETSVFGLAYPADLDVEQRYFRYLTREWNYRPESASPPEFRSTHFVFPWLALGLAYFDGDPTTFDLRYLGAVHWLFYVVAVYLAARAIGYWLSPARVVLYALLAFIATDSGYVAYFHSFYFESATLLFGLAMAAAAVPLAVRLGWSELAVFSATAALFVGAKRQNTPLALLLGAFLLLLAVRYFRSRPRWALGAIAGAALIGWCANAIYQSAPPDTSRRNAFQVVAMTLLPHSPSVDSDLRALGLGQSVKHHLGENSFKPDSPYHDPSAVPPEFGRGAVFSFLLDRPGRLMGVLASQAPAALRNHLDSVGNFSREAGRPSKDRWDGFLLWDTTRGLFAHWPYLLAFAAVHALLLLVAVQRLFAEDASPRARLLLLQGIIGALAVGGFVTGVLGDGNEVQKHLFVANLCFDLCVLGAAGWALAAWFERNG